MTESQQTDYIKRNADGTITLTLERPCAFGKEEMLKSLTFQRLRSKHAKGLKLQDMGVDETIILISKLTNEFPQAIEEMEMVDFVRAAEVVEIFLGSSARVGKTI